jgi:hypothetical protein
MQAAWLQKTDSKASGQKLKIVKIYVKKWKSFLKLRLKKKKKNKQTSFSFFLSFFFFFFLPPLAPVLCFSLWIDVSHQMATGFEPGFKAICALSRQAISSTPRTSLKLSQIPSVIHLPSQ